MSEQVASQTLGIVTLILTLVAYGAAIIRWVLSRERDHITDDTKKHELVDKEIGKLKDKHAELASSVSSMESQIESIPNRDGLDTLFDRFEARFTKQIEQIEQRLVGQVAQADEIHEKRTTSILNKLSDVLNAVTKSQGGA